MFKDLYEEERLSDVTLVSDDQTQFKVSACSPVFKKIIDNNPSQHPMIYLRGIQSYEMWSLLQFMYLGEARFYYERMEQFIKVAKDLEVKEISKSADVKTYECPECGTVFTAKRNMLTHYKYYNILVISVIIKLQHIVLFRDILSQSMHDFLLDSHFYYSFKHSYNKNREKHFGPPAALSGLK